MVHGCRKGGQGPRPPGFENFNKKRMFSQFGVGKNKFHHFWLSPRKILEKSPSAPPEKKNLLTPMHWCNLWTLHQCIVCSRYSRTLTATTFFNFHVIAYCGRPNKGTVSCTALQPRLNVFCRHAYAIRKHT